MTDEIKNLLEQNKAALLDALDRQHARGRSEDKTSQILYNQLGVVVWWLERYKGPMPPDMPQKVQEALDLLGLIAQPPRAVA